LLRVWRLDLATLDEQVTVVRNRRVRMVRAHIPEGRGFHTVHFAEDSLRKLATDDGRLAGVADRLRGLVKVLG
jgi:hypothetical protein